MAVRDRESFTLRAGSKMHKRDMHRIQVANMAQDWVNRKYAAGQLEHGGDLNRKPVLEHLAEEATDMLIYTIVFSDQIQQAIKCLEAAKETDRGWRLVESALNILKHGNPEGEAEEELNELKRCL